MKLSHSHVYSYENKYNHIGGNALNNLKKINLGSEININLVRLFVYSHKISKRFGIVLTIIS